MMQRFVQKICNVTWQYDEWLFDCVFSTNDNHTTIPTTFFHAKIEWKDTKSIMTSDLVPLNKKQVEYGSSDVVVDGKVEHPEPRHFRDVFW